MYKASWAIESFFRWIKQNLNVPVLFGATKNAVYNQLFAALIAYVLLKWLYNQTKSSIPHAKLSLAGFQRMLLYARCRWNGRQKWPCFCIIILRFTGRKLYDSG
ncbi:hypothetical protein BA724_01390 [Domibacillus iocasae]|uniref:Transposase IS4-like domain-containing protein n=2 Tax=Domibacillus iocasae TaxID=1714016 RepID=A0A1E7DQY6_9BACI|nr:hypothetical protein BA724_01390 [Domibacillus iocasae]